MQQTRLPLSCVLMVTVTLLTLPAGAAGEAELAKQIAAAQSGSTVKLPEGVLKLGDLKVPAGVSLQGAGYGKTILDAAGFTNGVELTGDGSGISDLTIRNASSVGVSVADARNVIVERVLIRDCAAGLTISRSAACRVANVILTGSRAGIGLSATKDSSIANVSLVDHPGTGLTITGCENVAVFNTLVAGAAVAINLGEGNTKLAIDHNIYNASFIGRYPGHPIRKKIDAWRGVSRLDKHSQTIGVQFKDAAAGDFHVVSPLTWSPNRASTSDWGVAELAGFKAPATDIDGNPRVGGVDIGACETALPVARKSDGTFTIKDGRGVASVALYRGQTQVASLFRNAPLAKGTHEYWLPSRDWQGKPLTAGEYELRVVEADLSLEYIAAAGNGDLESSLDLPASTAKRASLDVHMAAFDDSGMITLAQSGFECGLHVRAFDSEMKKVLWNVEGGGRTVGMTIDEKGRVYVLRHPNSLLRLSLKDGSGVNFKNGGFQQLYGSTLTAPTGAAWLDGKLYIADQAANKVFVLAGDELAVVTSFDVKAPAQLSVDRKAKLLWVLSDKKLLALDAEGKTKAEITPTADPTLLAAARGTLAVYDKTKNQVLVLDVADAAKPTVLRTVGRGGEGFGKIEGDKFWAPRSIALSDKGELIVVDSPRVILFDAQGKTKRHHMGMWGQAIAYGYFAGDDRIRFLQIGGGYDIVLDPKNRRWEPGNRYKYTVHMDNPRFMFAIGEKSYLVGSGRENGDEKGAGQFCIYEAKADGTMQALVRYGYLASGGLFVQRDADGDGLFTKEPQEPVLEADGKTPINVDLLGRSPHNADYRKDGSLAIAFRNGMLIVPLKVVNGVPQYDFAARKMVVGSVEGGDAKYISPYDHKSVEAITIAEDAWLFDDGSFAATMTVGSSAGPDMGTEHARATDLAGFDSSGKLQWLAAMDPHGLKYGFHGIYAMGDLVTVSRGSLVEFETITRDGLGTGTIGVPPEMGWGGMWIDNHRQTHGFVGNDGKSYIIIGDYMAQAYHWLCLQGTDKIQRQSAKVSIDATLAKQLAAEPAVAVAAYPVPEQPRVTIKKLAKPLPVDGDLAKWRALGVQPLLVTPECGRSGDPRSNSAILRLAWSTQGLHVQVVKFDNVVTFHQSDPSGHYRQDGIELNVNGFFDGWKYNVTRMNGQDIILRDRWGSGGLMDKSVPPRVIKVLDTADDVQERKLLEACYGVDMSKCKVVVVEFLLTPDAASGMKPAIEWAAGKSFLLGVAVNDNDVPGSDQFDSSVWPVNYGTFSREECFARMTLGE